MGLLGNRKIANIEIQDYVIRYAETKSKNTSVVTQLKEHYIPTGLIESGKIVNKPMFLKALKFCARKWKLKRKLVRFIVPDSSVIVRIVDVPSEIEDDELRGHMYFELGHSIHLPFENPVLDAVNLGVHEDKKRVLVVASSAEIVDSYYEHFKDEKAVPRAADISGLCQYRLYHHYDMTNDDDIFLVAQYNVKTVTVSIFEKHQPVFTQNIEIPYQDETWRVIPLNKGGTLTREQFDQKKVMSAFEEIYTEIERILRFYHFTLTNGNKKVTKMLLTGDHPFLDELLDGTKVRLDIPINILPPLKIQTAKKMEIGYRFYNVIGLAMKEGV